VPEVQRPVENIVKDLLIVLAVKGDILEHHCEENDACAPDVSLAPIITSDYFGCHIIRSSKMLSEALVHIVSDFAACSKVYDLYNVTFSTAKQNVFGLDVTVDHVVGVQVFEHHDDLVDNSCTLPLSIATFLFPLGINLLEKLTTSA